jgi:dipeptidyl aminopeptidase/acylaminoacyl peptidase
MLVHGSEDSLVPVGISRKMTEALRAESAAPVVYLEIPGAQHAFDIFASPRSEHAKLGVMQFLCYCYAEHQRSKR